MTSGIYCVIRPILWGYLLPWPCEESSNGAINGSKYISLDEFNGFVPPGLGLIGVFDERSSFGGFGGLELGFSMCLIECKPPMSIRVSFETSVAFY